MGGPSVPDQSHTTQSMMQNYLRYLPQILQATSNVQPGINQTQAASANDILNQYAPGMAQTGQNIQNSNTIAGTNTVGSALGGQGGQNVIAADALNRQINPEYYANRAAASKGANDLIGSINLNGLSPGEANAVERSLGQNQSRTGNLGLDNPTNVVSNAMNFGNAMSQKRAEMAGAIGTASNLMGNSQSTNFGNVMNSALTQPPSGTNTNFGLAALPLGGTQAFSGGQGLLGTLGGINSTAAPLAYQSSVANSAQGWASNVGSASGLSSCCFIFLEATNGILPWYVRKERDYYYKKQPLVADGYKKMAKWLVPMMRKSKVLKQFINFCMVRPITYYGGWKNRVNKMGWIMYPSKVVWFFIWKHL